MVILFNMGDYPPILFHNKYRLSRVLIALFSAASQDPGISLVENIYQENHPKIRRTTYG
jgi:hypothetical protein